MSNDAVFFRRQADAQRADAEASTLSMVRERCERAAASWEAMATRAERAEAGRRDRAAVATPANDATPANEAL